MSSDLLLNPPPSTDDVRRCLVFEATPCNGTFQWNIPFLGSPISIHTHLEQAQASYRNLLRVAQRLDGFTPRGTKDEPF